MRTSGGVAEYLHDIAGESTPVSLHVLGEPPATT